MSSIFYGNFIVETVLVIAVRAYFPGGGGGNSNQNSRWNQENRDHLPVRSHKTFDPECYISPEIVTAPSRAVKKRHFALALFVWTICRAE